ncbi:VpsF family polysaccharide biosynthesis protein [Vibrio mimicus]|uniref:VpsF family polysaccharide biosynthesis protein n=1 Tax=Vibrio mimicus TaxID=674 RepID=UPI002FF40BA6
MLNVNVYFSVMIALISSVIFGSYFLENLGIPYVSDGGSPLLKIHLYSYIILLSYFIVSIKFGMTWFNNKLGEYSHIWLISLSCLSFVIIYGYFRYGTSGMAYMVNTFLVSLMIIPLISILNHSQVDKILRLVSYLILINSIIAIFEFLTNSRIVEVEFKDFSYFRSSALLTHPLNNSLITVSLSLLLFNKTFLPGIVYILITLLALFSFGGRSALVIFVFVLFMYCFPKIWKFITSGVQANKKRVALFMLPGYFAILLFSIIIIHSGITERIMSNLYIDGSASARIDVFFLLEQLTVSEWIWGASHRLLESIELYIGINVIENYFIGWIFTFGLIGTIPLAMCVFLPLYYFSKNGDYSSKLSVLIFFLVGITNNSLTTKTPVLLLLFCVLYLKFIQVDNRESESIKINNGELI